MTTQDSAARIRSLYDAVNRKDLQAIADFGAPFSEWLDVPFNVTTTGESAIIDPWKSWFEIFPDATCEVRRLVALGDTVVAQGIGRGTHRGPFNSPAGVLAPTGRRMEVQFCDVYRLKGGKIIRADSYFDFYGLLRQLAPNPQDAERADAGPIRGRRLARKQRQRTPANHCVGKRNTGTALHAYVGTWVTMDGQVRHELLPNGRYVEARGSREAAYQGRYAIEGDHVEYVDDTGFTADGDFRDGVLYHAGMILHRRVSD